MSKPKNEKTKTALNRRDFIGLTVAGSAALFTQGCQNSFTDQNVNSHKITTNPQKIRTRYNISGSEDEAKRNARYFKEAVAKMKKISKDTPDNMMGWLAQAKIHLEHCGGGTKDIHFTSLFLSWHRAYLAYFEEVCRKTLCDLKVPDYDDFALPYWDWSKSAFIPEIFRGNVINEWNDELNSVEPPKDWNLGAEDQKWERIKDWEAECSEVGQTEIAKVWKSDIFDIIGMIPSSGKYYSGTLQKGIHNSIHRFVKGNMSSPSAAALDPLFWLHHANIDRIWDQWMKKHENEIPSQCPSSSNNFCNKCAAWDKEKDKQACLKTSGHICKWLNTEISGFPSVNGNSDSKQVFELLNISNLGYKYQDSEEIRFGDCINVKTINEDEYLIGTEFKNKKITNINNPITIETAELLTLPKNAQNLQNIQSAISQILTVKTASDTGITPISLLLTLEVEKPKDPAISARVFINPPLEKLSELPITDPSYLGTFSFFESLDENHHHNDETRGFIFDITDTILKMESFDLASAKISINPKFLNGSTDDSMGELRLISLQLLLAR